jgi:O-antigen/teichoic acid export membrane protein
MFRKHLHFDGLAKPAFIVFIAMVIGGACNYFFQSYMGHSLEPADYSELTSLLSVFYIITIPSNLIGITILRYVSKLHGEGKDDEVSWLIKRSFLISILIGLVLFLAIVMMIPWLDRFLEIPNDSVLFVLAAGGFLLMLGPSAVASAQGLQRFYHYSLYSLFSPLGKLFFGILLVTTGLGVGGAFGGMVIGTSLAFGIVYIAIWDFVRREKRPVDMSGMVAYVIPVAVATLGFTFITNIDTFLARGLMTAYDAGIYSSASMLGKIVLWLPAAITTVTFPRFSEAQSRNDDSRMLMRKSIWVVGMVLGAIWIWFFLFPEEIMNITYGYHYAEATICLPVVMLAFSLFGLASVFMNYGLAVGDHWFAGIIGAFTIFGVIMVILNHASPLGLGYNLLFTAGGICIVSAAYMELRWYLNRRKERAQ